MGIKAVRAKISNLTLEQRTTILGVLAVNVSGPTGKTAGELMAASSKILWISEVNDPLYGLDVVGLYLMPD